MAYDAHELACHFVSQHAGLYRRQGLEPQLIDANFLGETLAESCFHMACGAALASWLKGGGLRVVTVAARRPMFWLYASESVTDIAQLAGGRIAGYPDAAPPAVFLRAALSRQQIPPGELEIMPARDDLARLGLLVDGSVEAAVVSSALPLSTLQNHECRQLLCLGDEVSAATTGLAVSDGLREKNPNLVRAMCECFRQALQLIQEDPEMLKSAMRVGLTSMADADLSFLVEALQAAYTSDGTVAAKELRDGVDVMAAAIGVDVTRPIMEFYDFSYLRS